jgi:hypothetical protein
MHARSAASHEEDEEGMARRVPKEVRSRHRSGAAASRSVKRPRLLPCVLLLVHSAVMAVVTDASVGLGVVNDGLPVIAVTTLVAYEMRAGTFFGKSRLTSNL